MGKVAWNRFRTQSKIYDYASGNDDHDVKSVLIAISSPLFLGDEFS